MNYNVVLRRRYFKYLCFDQVPRSMEENDRRKSTNTVLMLYLQSGPFLNFGIPSRASDVIYDTHTKHWTSQSLGVNTISPCAI